MAQFLKAQKHEVYQNKVHVSNKPEDVLNRIENERNFMA